MTIIIPSQRFSTESSPADTNAGNAPIPNSRTPDLLESVHSAFLISFLTFMLFPTTSVESVELCRELENLGRSIQPIDDVTDYTAHRSRFEMVKVKLRHIVMNLAVPTLETVDDQGIDGTALWRDHLNNALHDSPTFTWRNTNKEFEQDIERLRQGVRLALYTRITGPMTTELQEVFDLIKQFCNTQSSESAVGAKTDTYTAFSWAVGRVQLLERFRVDSIRMLNEVSRATLRQIDDVDNDEDMRRVFAKLNRALE